MTMSTLSTPTPTRERASAVSPNPVDYLRALLEEQRALSVAERFAQRHVDTVSPLQARHYRDLIPLSAPKPGEQYAFEVDLDSCSGCKACVAACHSLNGLDEGEAWRSVGLVVLNGPDASAAPSTQHVTTACHHCVEPGCLQGCPVMAYDKDPRTGIVKHLDDQCIGCQYCVFTCPYEVPAYHSGHGIVRKCDLCQDRLAVSEAPACVQGCPTRAIRVVNVPIATLVTPSSVETLVPGSAASSITQPATRYRSQRLALSSMRGVDEGQPRVREGHLPLVGMLVLTQASVGVLMGASTAASLGWGLPDRFIALAAALAASGVLISVMHLGRPLGAFRAFLGWRTSWLSREIIALGVYVKAVALLALLTHSPWPLPQAFARLLPAALVGTCALGLLGVHCSVMVYVATRRSVWRLARTGGVFTLGTATAACITAAALATQGLAGVADARPAPLVPLALSALAASCLLGKLLAEFAPAWGWGVESGVARSVARTLQGPLRPATRRRLFFAALALALLVVAALVALGAPRAGAGLILISLIPLGIGDLFERYLFFAAMATPTMPGGFAAIGPAQGAWVVDGPRPSPGAQA